MTGPGSPLWWVGKLETELNARQAKLNKMARYYEGDHPLPFVTKAHNSKLRDEFRELLDDSRSNFMRLVVDAVEERLNVEGFRLSAAADATSDQKSWEIWQANQMDAESQTAILEALIQGVSYLSVWEGDPHPTIAVEDARQTIVAYTPGSNFRKRDAALKVWKDDLLGMRRANLYLPGGIYKFKASNLPASRWQELEAEFVDNRLGIVPIVPLRNRPRLLCEGESELADVFRVQNQINGFLFLLALAGYFGAHKQRWAVGLKIHEDDNGNPIEPFDVAIDRLWMTENPNAEFGEFQQTALDGYIKAIEQKVLHIAVTTRTPRHYLIQEGQSPSGDAIKSAESGLVKKAERKHRPFGEGFEETIRLARLFAGESDAPVDSEMVWADPSTPTEAETTDAVIKQFQAGLIPWEAALEKLGYSQTQIQRFAGMRAADALMRQLLNPAPEQPVPEPEAVPA
jgi:hypothetical protein